MVKKNGMSAGLKIFISFSVGIVVVLGITISWLFSIKFQATKFENQLDASYKSMQNVYSSVDKILLNSGITVKNFGETKLKAIKIAIERYSDKPDLMMQWVQENPQQIDSKIWENFQSQIEVQYTKFEMEQKAKISISQAYKDFLEASIRGNVARIVWSYPSNDIVSIMEQIIQTDTTKDTFKTGIDITKNVLE